MKILQNSLFQTNVPRKIHVVRPKYRFYYSAGSLVTGSDKQADEFDEMDPETAKHKLGLLVKKIDKNQDGFVTKEELTDWILMSFR